MASHVAIKVVNVLAGTPSSHRQVLFEQLMQEANVLAALSVNDRAGPLRRRPTMTSRA